MSQTSDFKWSPIGVRFQIGQVRPVSCVDIHSERGRLPQGDVRFQRKLNVRFQIGLGSSILKIGDVQFLKKVGEQGGKRAGYNPWELWSIPCGAWLALGLKPLRLPRARSATVRDSFLGPT